MKALGFTIAVIAAALGTTEWVLLELARLTGEGLVHLSLKLEEG